MGVKIYKKNNYCIVDNGSKKEFFAGDEMSIASFDGGEWVIWNTAKQTESFSFNYTMVEDENGTPVGDASAVEEYLTLNTNFKAASGGSGAAWGAITGVLTEQTDLQTELDNKVNKNTAVAGATKAKITFDSKGLVTDGENLSASDIPNIAQTQVTNLVTDLSNKQENLISGTNIKTINGTSVLGSGDLVISGGGGGGGAPATQILIEPMSNSYYGIALDGHSTSNLTWIYNGQLLFTAFTPGYDFDFNAISFVAVQAATVGGLLKVVVYSDSNGKPGTKLFESATVSTDTTGMKWLTGQNFTFNANETYWIATVSNDAVYVRAIDTYQMYPVFPVIANSATTQKYTNYFYNSNFNSLPTTMPTLTSANLSTDRIPMITFRKT